MTRAERTRRIPPTAEAIERLLAVSGSELVLDQMYLALERRIRCKVDQILRSEALSAEQQRAMERVPDKVIAELRAECNWDVLRMRAIALYRDTFDQEDVERLIQFYRSVAGRTCLSLMRTVMNGSATLESAHSPLFFPGMEQAMDKAVRQAKRVRKRAAISPRLAASQQALHEAGVAVAMKRNPQC